MAYKGVFRRGFAAQASRQEWENIFTQGKGNSLIPASSLKRRRAARKWGKWPEKGARIRTIGRAAKPAAALSPAVDHVPPRHSEPFQERGLGPLAVLPPFDSEHIRIRGSGDAPLILGHAMLEDR